MNIQTISGWEDYELLDSGEGQRLERFGKYTIMRPDPQAIWRPLQSKSLWAGADAVFERLTSSKGKWNVKGKMPEKWIVKYKDLSFWVRLTPFKHTGLFPEQAIQWDWIASHVAKA